jgi:hypothetical protein
MSFKDQLLKKIEIDGLARTIIASIRPAGTMHHIDKAAMELLLDIAGYTPRTKRSVPLYVLKTTAETSRILVLDNDLAIYNTTEADVVLRKNPLVKEMISFGNIRKILSDADVIVSKKETTVRMVHQECVATLDLSFTDQDLDQIKMDGAVALDTADSPGVVQSLTLFAQMLGYIPAPRFLAVTGYTLFCGVNTVGAGEGVYGPHVIYHAAGNRLMMVSVSIKQGEKEKVELLLKAVQGVDKPDMEGAAVLAFLKDRAGQAGPINTEF